MLPKDAYPSLTNTSVRNILDTIPKADQQVLSRFFEEVIVNHQFGYTIFGDKPVSFAGYFLDLPSDINFLKRSYLYLEQGKTTIEKYKYLLQTKKFILKFQSDPEKKWVQIYLVNKQSLLKKIEEHRDVFKKTLGDYGSAECLLHELSKEDTTLEAICRGSEELKGIMLGYGARNAFLFQRREELIRILYDSYTPPSSVPAELGELLKTDMAHLDNSSLEPCIQDPCLDFKTLLEEYQSIENIFETARRDSQFLSFFSLPVFCADSDDPETEQLYDKYSKTRQVLIREYSQGNFLEVTLCKMMET